jgi:hypothetical protein
MNNEVSTVTKLEELEIAIDSLPEKEFSEFRRWFLEKDWEKWDHEIVEDSKAGKLDFLVKEAMKAKKEGTLKDL